MSAIPTHVPAAVRDLLERLTVCVEENEARYATDPA